MSDKDMSGKVSTESKSLGRHVDMVMRMLAEREEELKNEAEVYDITSRTLNYGYGMFKNATTEEKQQNAIQIMLSAFTYAKNHLGEDHKITKEIAARGEIMLKLAEAVKKNDSNMPNPKAGGKKQKSTRRKSRKSKKSIRRRR